MSATVIVSAHLGNLLAEVYGQVEGVDYTVAESAS
jgi:hypothetical protein